jgi:asparagine synthase (glutamine-hydrolysing)
VKRAGLFEPAAVERLVKKCSAGKAAGFRDNAAFLGILSTQILHRLFVERKFEDI